MERLPKEFLYVLIFIGIVLFQYLVKRFGQHPQPEGQTQEPQWEVPEEMAEPVAERAAPPQPRAQAEQFGRSAAQRGAPLAPSTRRFSRRSLLGNRRALQEAVVLATILGPCRAMEPPGDGASGARSDTGRRATA